MFPYYPWVATHNWKDGRFVACHDHHGMMNLWDDRFVVPKLVEGHLLFVPERITDFQCGDLAGFKLSLGDQVAGTGTEPEIWFSINDFRKLIMANTTYAMFELRRQRNGVLGKPYMAVFSFAPLVEFETDPDQNASRQSGDLFYWFAKRKPGGKWEYWQGPAGYQYKLVEHNPVIGAMDDPLDLDVD